MIGRLNRQLSLWTKENIISESQAESIRAFEQSRDKARSRRGFALVGVTAILIGVLSVVASKWSQIPAELKILIHAILNIGVVVAILKLDQVKMIVRDLLVTALFGLTLTFIALIGQTYQMHGDLAVTVGLWTLVCTPFIWIFGRGVIAITPWLIAVLVSLCMLIDKFFSIEDIWQSLLSMAILFVPLLLILGAHIGFVAEQRPAFAVVMKRYGMWLMAFMAVIPAITFWDITNDFHIDTVMTVGIMAAGLVVSTLALQSNRAIQIFVAVTGVFIILPVAFATAHIDILNAFLFVTYFAFLAWWGARQNNTSLIDWSIRFIILRLIILYFEVFGSLAIGGLGLILTGVIILITLRNLNKITLWGRRLLGQG